MEQPQQRHDAIGSLVCFNRQSSHTRTSKQSHTRSTVQQILPYQMGTHARTSNNAKKTIVLHFRTLYADIQDDSYISNEDIEDYPETFMPRPRIMPTGIQEPVPLQQPDTPHNAPRRNTEQRLEQDLHRIRRVLFPSETEPEGEPMPLDNVNLEDESMYIPNDSPDWLDKPSPDRHLCIYDEHQDRCKHFRAPSHPDLIVTYDNPSGFMSLQDLEDMDILADIEFSSDDELPDLIYRTIL